MSTDTLEFIEIDFDISAEIGCEDCEAPAKWWVMHPRGKHPMCTGCKARVSNNVEQAIRFGQIMECKRHNPEVVFMPTEAKVQSF